MTGKTYDMGRFSQWARKPYDEDETRKTITHGKVAAERRMRDTLHSRQAANIIFIARTTIAVIAVLAATGLAAGLVRINADTARLESQTATTTSEIAAVRRAEADAKAGKTDAKTTTDTGKSDAPAAPNASDIARDKTAQAIVDIQNSGDKTPGDRLKPYFPDTNPKSYMGFAISPLSLWNTIVPDCTWEAYTQPGSEITAFACSRGDGAIKAIATARWDDGHYTDFIAHVEGMTGGLTGTGISTTSQPDIQAKAA